MTSSRIGKNSVIGNSTFGCNIQIGCNCIIEDGVIVGNDCFIDNGVTIRANTVIGDNSYIGSNSIIGEYSDIKNRPEIELTIGNNAIVRSGSIIYSGSKIGDNFNTGHRVTIREKSKIGTNVSVGTLSDIQGHCKIGSYTRFHSNVHIGQKSIIDSFVWIFPYVVLTNDPTPPSNNLLGVHVKPFAIIATGSVILPGKTIGQDTLIGAGSVVTKDVEKYSVVVGNPAKKVSSIFDIKNKETGENIYPWRHYFSRNMPWEDGSFKEWFSQISDDDAKKYCIERLNLNSV